MSENQQPRCIVKANDPSEDSITTDWRQSMKTLQQKVSYVYHNRLLIPHDVTFVVTKNNEEVLISAHSFVLALSSSVLDALIAKHRRDDKQESHISINVSRGDERTVQSFLEFLYCGKADLNGFNYEEIMDLVTLAWGYKTSKVIDKTSEYLLKLVTLKNSAQILEFLHQLPSSSKDQVSPYFKCLDFIRRHAQDVLSSDSIVNLSESNLCRILSLDFVEGVTELFLFEACLRWGKAECDRRSLTASTENLRTVLSKLVRCIRFPVMTPDEFSSSIVTKDILTTEEIADILLYISVSEDVKPNVTPKLFSTAPRNTWLSFGEKQNSCASFVSSQINLCDLNELDACLKEYLYENQESFIIRSRKLQLNELNSRFNREIKSSIRQRIRTFALENVQLVPPVETILKSIRLPSLEQFTLQLVCSKENEKSIADSLYHDFRRYLFFATKAKYYPWPYPSQYLWRVGVDILLTLNGITFLEIDQKRNAIVINGLNEYGQILESCKNEDIQSLSVLLRNSRSRVLTSSFTQLSKLCIHNVSCIGGQVLLTLKNLNSLTELILHKCGFSSIDLALIANSHKLLKKLSISYAHLVSTDEICMKNLVSLHYFTLWNSSWDNSFLKSLQHVKKLKSFCVNNEELIRSLFPFINLFVQQKGFSDELIAAGFTWGMSGDDLTKDNRTDEKLQVQNLLEKFGIMKNKVRLTLSNTFTSEGTLIRDEQRCLLLSEKDLLKLMFERFNCGAFFDSVACFEDKMNACSN